VKHGLPATPNNEEPEKLAQAVKLLSCRYVVITSVTRDDLPDGGAALYAAAVKKIKETNPGVKVELLIPDFMGSEEALKTVLDASPDVLGHNIEVVRSLFSSHRPQGGYQRSMLLISNSKKLRPDVLTKSGLMAGLGETRDEISGTLRDLRGAGCDIVTAGQYLQPSKECVTVERYLEPEEFREIEAEALGLGFVSAKCGPLVRSSYRAEQLNTEISEK
jgi:lipoic acid synthetase